ncbi:tRNA-specific adenosine deaminase subunit tad3 [Marasmius tenuissimus]|nr:tRNA-specific adenosine deaminase subunit tad3 [Marasmius tenuissimus]
MSSSSKPPQHLNSTGCHIQVTPGKGRGVFASRPITSNTLIEISPVLLFTKDEYERYGKHTVLDHYTFIWKDGTASGKMALALGLGSLFNHSPHPNVSYTLDTSTDSIQYRTCRDVEEGEELCIYYGSQLWFEEAENAVDGSSLSEEEEDGWGGLSMVAGEGTSHNMDPHEIIDEEQLPFTRIKPPPEEEMLENVRTAPAWVIDVPDPRYITALLKWLKKTGLDSPDLGHLKRIRKHDNKTTLLLCLATGDDDSPPSIPGDLLPDPSIHQHPVPLSSALTPIQLTLKSTFWPTYYTPRKKDQVEDWTRAQCDWAWDAMRRAVAEGKKARAKGELPMGAYVPAPFRLDDNQNDNGFSGFDTRTSTSHPLRHAVLNLVRDLGESHHNKAESNTPSYLLTSRSIFLTHEPCIMCTMALLHSRVKEVFYLIPMARTGGCGGDGAGTCPPIPWLKGVNHRFEICRWTGEGRGIDSEGLRIDEDLDA